MCGRFRLSKTDKEVMKQFGVEIDPDYSPRYNISTSQQVAVLQSGSNGLHHITVQ